MKPANTQSGFSLVELAIVLVIIGLIVGGILKGQDLIHSARLNRVQTGLNEIRLATNTFQDRFVALPGDLSDGSLVGLDEDDGGDGNSRIGESDDGTWHDGEHAKFYAHLGAAGLLGGVDAAAIAGDDLGSASDPSEALAAAIGGYFTVGYADPEETIGGNIDAKVSHWVRVATDARPQQSTDAGVFTTEDLRSIDLKADDGRSNTGSILGNGNGSPACRTEEGGYNPDTEEAVCVGWFKL